MSDWAGIKYALNSTLGTEGFQALDAYISSAMSNILSGEITEYTEAGSYTYQVPAGVRVIYVTACGGGGGGAAGSNRNRNGYYGGGGGGGGAAVERHPIYVGNLETIDITIGKGGTGSQTFINLPSYTDEGDGEDGESTSIGSYLTLAGGKGGKAKYDSQTNDRPEGGAAGGTGGGAGGYGGGPSSGIFSSAGEDGILGSGGATGNQKYYGGGGGGSVGNGGNAGHYTSNNDSRFASDGQRGGGGAGAFGDGKGYYAGSGGDGYVKIEAGVTLSPIRNVQRGTFLKTSADSNDRVTITLTGFSDANKMIAVLNSANEPGSDSPDSGCYLYSLDSDSISIQMTEYSDSSSQGGSYQVIEFK